MTRCCAPPAVTGAARPALREDYKKFRPNVERLSPRSPPAVAGAQTPLPRHRPQQRLAQEPHRRPEPAQPHQPRPGPRERRMGPGLTPSSTGPDSLQPSRMPARLAPAGRATTLPARQGPGLPPHRRPCWCSSRPNIPFVQGTPSELWCSQARAARPGRIRRDGTSALEHVLGGQAVGQPAQRRPQARGTGYSRSPRPVARARQASRRRARKTGRHGPRRPLSPGAPLPWPG